MSLINSCKTRMLDIETTHDLVQTAVENAMIKLNSYEADCDELCKNYLRYCKVEVLACKMIHLLNEIIPRLRQVLLRTSEMTQHDERAVQKLLKDFEALADLELPNNVSESNPIMKKCLYVKTNMDVLRDLHK